MQYICHDLVASPRATNDSVCTVREIMANTRSRNREPELVRAPEGFLRRRRETLGIANMVTKMYAAATECAIESTKPFSLPVKPKETEVCTIKAWKTYD